MRFFFFSDMKGLARVAPLAAILLTSLSFSAGASTFGRQQKKEIEGLSSQIGNQIEPRGNEQTEREKEEAKKLLAQPLTVDSAVRLAWLNSPRLQAILQDLKIAKADRSQANVWLNPEAEAVFLRSDRHDATKAEYTLTQDIGSLLFYPLRRSVAGAHYSQAKLNMGHELLKEVAEIKKAYYSALSQTQAQALLQSILESAGAGAELVERQSKAGNINALHRAGQEALLHEARLALLRVEASATEARERMNAILGVTSSDWKLPESLPPLPSADPALADIEKVALSRRLDYEAARQEVNALQRSVALSRLSLLPSLKAGVGIEKEEGDTSFGPALQLEVPLFGWWRGSVGKARGRFDQSRFRLKALESEIQSEIRSAHKRMVSARGIADTYQKKLIPLREEILAETQKHYNFMLVGVYQLLEAKQDEVEARRDHIEALENYWSARAELEKSAGGRLPEGTAAEEILSPEQMESEIPAKKSTDQEHNHGGHE